MNATYAGNLNTVPEQKLWSDMLISISTMIEAPINCTILPISLDIHVEFQPNNNTWSLAALKIEHCSLSDCFIQLESSRRTSFGFNEIKSQLVQKSFWSFQIYGIDGRGVLHIENESR